MKGEGNSYTAEFWEYDPRVGRRWNLDPKPTVGLSEYSAFSNSPIGVSDPLGDTSRPVIFFEPEKTFPNVYKTDMEYANNPLNSKFVVRIPIVNWTILLFNYEADPKKQAANRKATRDKMGGMSGSRASSLDAHEVAYASTKQGGNNSETIMRLIPAGENRSHGTLLKNAYQNVQAVDGDPVFIILIPDKKRQLPYVVPFGIDPKKKDDNNFEEFYKKYKNKDLIKKREPYTGYPGQVVEDLVEEYFHIKIPPLLSPAPAPVPVPIP